MSQHSHRRSDTATGALVAGLGWFSIGLGLAELLASQRLGNGLGMEGKSGVLRAYGVREIMTGAGILLSRNPTPWIWARVAGDALDMATLAPGLSADNRRRTFAGAAFAAVAAVTLIDIWATRRLHAEEALPPQPMRDYSARSGFPEIPDRMRGRAVDWSKIENAENTIH